MRIVALEEHFAIPELVRRIDPAAILARGWPPPEQRPPHMMQADALAEVGEARLAGMDEAGISVQVLSAAGPGADLMGPNEGPDMARAYNDRLAAVVAGRPERFAGFAHLPMSAPRAAADELERAVVELGFRGAMINGLSQGRFLDHPDFEPLLARAEALDTVLYIHPNLPPAAVQAAYYDGLPGPAGFLLGGPGWGWHAETAVHVLRLVLSGALDRHPRLRIVIGHMGEGLPAILDRCDKVFASERRGLRSVSQAILDQVWITTSGFFSLAPFTAAMMTFGVDRILFSVDYPFSPNLAGRRFLDALPVSPDDRAKIAHRNADALLKL